LFFLHNVDFIKDVIYIIYFPHAGALNVLLLIATLTVPTGLVPLLGGFEVKRTLSVLFAFSLFDTDADPETHSQLRVAVALGENAIQLLV